MSRLGELGGALYRGEKSYDFVGRRRTWFVIAAIILLLSIAGLIGPKLHLGVEFQGGSVFTFRAPASVTETQARDAVAEAQGTGLQVPIAQRAGDRWRVTTQSLAPDQVTAVQKSVASRFGLAQNDVDAQVIGPSWGGEVSGKALQGLIIFLVLVVIYLSIAFEWKMAVAALVALLHDMIITVGVYAWVGFEVTPASVIGFLTILGYSLYDTVVVFDKVRENTRPLLGGARMTYSEAANLAVNQTLVRSINTSVIALLPVAAILFIGTTFLGAGTLKDLSLALFVGMVAGTVSSIFIATPLLVVMKDREPQYVALAKRVAARRAAAGKPGAGTRATGRATGKGEPRDTPDEPAGEIQDTPEGVGAGPAGTRPGGPLPGQGRKGTPGPAGRKKPGSAGKKKR
ncbi:protein translocase subunit SecF [Bailinhaonella thermotolerans]|uniref:Protein-export membrane protein SecF n=1 Tax=Bailinhaonella thermotolerans TaxID=1070861 RepID=A0A3A4B5Z8_9ACTN|nr:protein translocase subunit SecF [Bailinhaonella thermotolerans]RJL33987.1 protein translocase subunit SecF [Bailinhaonella thermotolerans]